MTAKYKRSTHALLHESPWMSVIIDVEGVFLQGQFENGEELYIEVPDGFQEWYEGDVVL